MTRASLKNRHFNASSAEKMGQDSVAKGLAAGPSPAQSTLNGSLSVEPLEVQDAGPSSMQPPSRMREGQAGLTPSCTVRGRNAKTANVKPRLLLYVRKRSESWKPPATRKWPIWPMLPTSSAVARHSIGALG
ncbi:unnamed protein product [Protopolystoma xenopodis]|uniref:Uncharacterized protein n=1 Tax=Protopolystoma xenopodis TaxID=117903 RepID=A0A3S5BRR7_9PLAT|nr:unnamed protein product [Protopolystoma xenopodis]